MSGRPSLRPDGVAGMLGTRSFGHRAQVAWTLHVVLYCKARFFSRQTGGINGMMAYGSAVRSVLAAWAVLALYGIRSITPLIGLETQPQ